MSIWSSIGLGGPAIQASHDGLEDDPPTIDIGVATSGISEYIRLTANDDTHGWANLQMRALLTHDSARLLRDRLTQALGEGPQS